MFNPLSRRACWPARRAWGESLDFGLGKRVGDGRPDSSCPLTTPKETKPRAGKDVHFRDALAILGICVSLAAFREGGLKLPAQFAGTDQRVGRRQSGIEDWGGHKLGLSPVLRPPAPGASPELRHSPRTNPADDGGAQILA